MSRDQFSSLGNEFARVKAKAVSGAGAGATGGLTVKNLYRSGLVGTGQRILPFTVADWKNAFLSCELRWQTQMWMHTPHHMSMAANTLGNGVITLGGRNASQALEAQIITPATSKDRFTYATSSAGVNGLVMTLVEYANPVRNFHSFYAGVDTPTDTIFTLPFAIKDPSKTFVTARTFYTGGTDEWGVVVTERLHAFSDNQVVGAASYMHFHSLAITDPSTAKFMRYSDLGNSSYCEFSIIEFE